MPFHRRGCWIPIFSIFGLCLAKNAKDQLPIGMATPLTLNKNVGYSPAEDVYFIYQVRFPGLYTGRQNLKTASGDPVKGAGKSVKDLILAGTTIDPFIYGNLSGEFNDVPVVNQTGVTALSLDKQVAYIENGNYYITYLSYGSGIFVGVQEILDFTTRQRIQGKDKSIKDLIALGAILGPSQYMLTYPQLVAVPLDIPRAPVTTPTEMKYYKNTEEENNKYASMVDSVSRQVEVNEWSYNNKMETVFVLQVIFIGVVMVSILFYFNGLGYLGSGFTWYAAALTIVIVVLIVTNRLYYTTARRDARFWNRRHFDEDRSMLSTYTVADPGWRDYLSAALRNFEPAPTCATCSPAPAS